MKKPIGEAIEVFGLARMTKIEMVDKIIAKNAPLRSPQSVLGYFRSFSVACASISFPAMVLAHRTFQGDRNQLLGFHGELHWQRLQHVLAEAVDHQGHRIFFANAALAAVEQLIIVHF